MASAAGPLSDRGVGQARTDAENLDIVDFELSNEELAAVAALDTGVRRRSELERIMLEQCGRPIPEASAVFSSPQHSRVTAGLTRDHLKTHTT